MSRLELLENLYKESLHNKRCYSEDSSMLKAKVGYEDSWEKEQEKLELIEELIKEEKESSFVVHYPIKYLYEQKNIRLNFELAYLEDRNKGVSCYLTADEIDEKGNVDYILVFSIHKKDMFDEEFDNITLKDISKEFFKDRTTLKKEMDTQLKEFYNDIKKDKFYSTYYESDKEEELNE